MKKKQQVINEWYIYLIEAENGMLYTGISKDVQRRFKEHSSSKKGAKFFYRSPPKKIIHTEGPVSLSTALKREREIKKMPRTKKIANFY